jgi:hypothetical protein
MPSMYPYPQMAVKSPPAQTTATTAAKICFRGTEVVLLPPVVCDWTGRLDDAELISVMIVIVGVHGLRVVFSSCVSHDCKMSDV